MRSDAFTAATFQVSVPHSENGEREQRTPSTEPSARERQHCTLPARVTRHGITFPFTFPETRGMTSQVAQWADTCLHLHSVVRAGEVSIGNLPVSALESLLVASCQWTADLCTISQAAAEAIRKHCRPLTHTRYRLSGKWGRARTPFPVPGSASCCKNAPFDDSPLH